MGNTQSVIAHQHDAHALRVTALVTILLYKRY